MSVQEDKERARLDIWLWRARFFKTRTMAAEFISGKGVRLQRGGLPVRKIDKPGYEIAPQDQLAFAFGGRGHLVLILSLGDRRGPPQEAATLYQRIEGV